MEVTNYLQEADWSDIISHFLRLFMQIRFDSNIKSNYKSFKVYEAGYFFFPKQLPS